MPKETFNLIPEEKQERVLQEATRLFAGLGFAQTDMARLAKAAGVAKGSLYNYFESKEDLYHHVCRRALEASRAAVYGGLDPAWDIYRQVEHIFRAGVRFALENPDYIALYANGTTAGAERLPADLSREVERHTAGHLKDLVRRGQAAGLVNPALDVNLTAFLINTVYIMFLLSLVSPHFRIRLQEYLELADGITGQNLEESLERTVALIHNVLRPPQDPGEAPRQENGK
ncbi:MAG: TetR/AcrR family transcriptional regulator [Deltaproteobacteria bacterium]|nr:TetR/AcrR family transcriptional regulator [Deltaproteobacteria bacterium]